MANPMQRHEERRVPLNRAGSGERVICAVRRRHEREVGDLSYLVTEYREGVREPQGACLVRLARADSTCGEPYPCMHPKATWTADPTLRRYRPTAPTP